MSSIHSICLFMHPVLTAISLSLGLRPCCLESHSILDHIEDAHPFFFLLTKLYLGLHPAFGCWSPATWSCQPEPNSPIPGSRLMLCSIWNVLPDYAPVVFVFSYLSCLLFVSIVVVLLLLPVEAMTDKNVQEILKGISHSVVTFCNPHNPSWVSPRESLFWPRTLI